ncbi:MAG: hypothetical protein A2091_10875 [Desulfuromonadales bacterium GWD2_61_12]|nr:MAG: hypothetical protein A2005_08200 [Desulfuromonadales bacterium GWC2_61_20]OGR32037.1 MAG: hypothetical protein A2091_10875 [Desulfuromonadales bacterium GWD2_61_12]HAD04733.1 hypothetical protein [Desulfuromonas sp.]HBT83120.1 hypothetical protein [Desulfuromonas sp.]
MKLIMVLAVAVSIILGCVHRPNIYAPRRTPSAEHQAAKTTAACLGCHDVGKFPHHDRDDDCFSCHKLCKGC